MIAVLGSFDGFHLGHQMLFESAKSMAANTSDSWCVVTFFPHPQSVLGRKSFHALFSETEKDILARCLEIPEIIRIPFSRSFAGMGPEPFFETLEKTLFVTGLIVGEDFRFGKDREGDSHLLRKLAILRGWKTTIVPAYSIDDQKVSSTSIRKKVISGDTRGAALELGYPFSILGMVKHGDGRGRNIGFPTLNLDLPGGKTIPARGVYTGSAAWRGRSFPAAISIGTNPTFPGNRELRCEAHIPGFKEDLYGEWVNLFFFRRIRREVTFGSPSALVAQMQRDVVESLDTWNQIDPDTRRFIECSMPDKKVHPPG
ncbi:MAG: riboflavin biosynthesis protein RibF [Thermovirgaceae bacterium]|nr:riboflavin biosynthesis protein RibF [Thermovirgaceae bacterium]